MKKNRYFSIISAVALLGLGACSEEVIQPNGGNNGNIQDGDDGLYLSVNIKMPTGNGDTRSYTDGENSSNSGTEVGTDAENAVNTVYLVLAQKSTDPAVNNKFIAWGEIPASNIKMSTNGTTYNSTAKFSKSDINEYYDSYVKNDDSREVNVFVFCNPTLQLLNTFQEEAGLDALVRDNKWVDAICSVNATDPTAEVIWSDHDFLMTNAEIATRTLPKTMDDWNFYTEPNKPFDLSGINADTGIDNSSNNDTFPRGPVKVERAAARFDFRDGSPADSDMATYPVIYGLTKDDDGNEVQGDLYVEIKLNKMSLVNMCKEFYYLRRVSPTGDNTDVTLCGAELPWFTNANGTLAGTDGNYVVGPYATMMSGKGITTDFSTYYNYPLFNNQGGIDNLTLDGWYTSDIKTVLSGSEDNYEYPEGTADVDKHKYHVWRYVTENVIPGIDEQQNGQTTGIVFKGQMHATEAALNSDDPNVKMVAEIINNVGDKYLTGDPATDPVLYKFTGVKNDVGGIYATWRNVEEAAKNAACTPVWEASNDKDKYPEGGYWRLEVNRSNTLFHAVYGDGSCGTYTFKTSAGKEESIPDPLGVDAWDVKSANYAWHQWQENTDSDKEEELYAAYKTAMTKANFTLYQSSYDGSDGNGYFCYYYYWNRHNDNGKNGIMGPMEFDVVRNNVYKIAVTKIGDIGHPRITANDPTPPTPTTKDEIDDVYISVDVEVLPWVVRINNAIF